MLVLPTLFVFKLLKMQKEPYFKYRLLQSHVS
jgi:hypothetical protein